MGIINSTGGFEDISVTGSYSYDDLISVGNFLISNDYSNDAVRIDPGDLNFKPIYNTATGGPVELTAGSPCAVSFGLVYESTYGWGSISYSTGNYTSFGLGVDPTFIRIKDNSPALEGTSKCILPLFSVETYYPLETSFDSVIFREFPSGTILSGQALASYDSNALSLKIGSSSFAVWPTTTEGQEGVAFDGTSTTVIDVISGYASASPFNCQKASATTVFCAARTSLNSTGIVYYNVSSGSFTAYNFTLDIQFSSSFIDKVSYVNGIPFFMARYDFNDGNGASTVATLVDSNTSTLFKVPTPQTSYLNDYIHPKFDIVSYADGIITRYPFKNSGLELAFINSTGAYLLFESAPGLATIPFKWTSFDNHAIFFATSVGYGSYNVTFVDEFGSVNAPITVSGFSSDPKGQCDFAVYVTSTEIGTIHKNGSSYTQSGNFTITNFVGFCKDGDFYALGTKELVTGLIRVSPDATTTLNSNIPSFTYDSVDLSDGKYYFSYIFMGYGPPQYLVNPSTDSLSSVDFYGTDALFGFLVCGSSNPSYSWGTADSSSYGRYKNDPPGEIRVGGGKMLILPFCGPDDRVYSGFPLDPNFVTLDTVIQRDFGSISRIPNASYQIPRGCTDPSCDTLIVQFLTENSTDISLVLYSGFSVAPPSFDSSDTPEETSSSFSVLFSFVSLLILIVFT